MRRTHPGKFAFLDCIERAFQFSLIPGEESGCGTQFVPRTGNEVTAKECFPTKKRDMTGGVTWCGDHFQLPDLLSRSVELIDLGRFRSEDRLKHSSEA